MTFHAIPNAINALNLGIIVLNAQILKIGDKKLLNALVKKVSMMKIRLKYTAWNVDKPAKLVLIKPPAMFVKKT